MRQRILIALLLAFAASSAHGDSLYQRLGGRQGLHPLVNDFVDMVFHDPRLRQNSDAKKFLDRAKPADMSGLLYEAVCEEAGGPCKASAASSALRNAVIAMDLTPTDWGAVMGDFSAEMAKFKLPAPEQVDLRAMMQKARASLSSPANE